MKLLQVKDLKIAFPKGKDNDQTVIHGINFELNRGEILGIVGESGSGKSLTALSIIGLLPNNAKINSNSKIILKKEVDLLATEERNMVQYRGSEIAMIFQEPMSSLNPSHKCGRQVMESIFLHDNLNKDEAKNRVYELFEQVGLNDKERVFESYPHQLSGGQVQRVMIAISLAGSPSILIADEPTTALDVTVQQSILKLLKKLREEKNNSTIFISHDLAVVYQLCDRVIVMQNGDIVESGETEEIFKNAQHPYTKGLIASRPPLRMKLRRLPTVDMFLNDPKLDVKDFYDQNECDDKTVGQHLQKLESNEELLRLSGVSKSYQVAQNGWFSRKSKKQALSKSDIVLRKGEILGVVGESGSGKSTLSQIACRLIDPDEGQVYYKNQDITNLNGNQLKSFRRNCQIIFQDPYSALNPRMKIGHSIKEAFDVHQIGKPRERRAWVESLLDQVGLDNECYDRYPHEFSGGQRQRISIARAIALKPEILICDESVSALDVSIQAQVLNLLKDLKESHNISYLFVSHDLSVIHYFADRVLVMRDGVIVERGQAGEIYRNPREVYTQNLIDSIPAFGKI